MNMFLCAATNAQGSRCTTELDVTEEQWAALSVSEQQDLIAEHLGDVMETWVQAGDPGCG